MINELETAVYFVGMVNSVGVLCVTYYVVDVTHALEKRIEQLV